MAAPAAAQAVRGTVVGTDGVPVPGMMVLLLDDRGVRHDASLSDRAGRFSVSAHHAGAFVLRAERVGYAATTSPLLHLAEGQTVEHRLTVNSSRIALPPITATGRQRDCTIRPRNGELTGLLWEEARKALASAALASQQARFQYVARLHRRRLRMSDMTAMYEDAETVVSEGKHPFLSAPIARLAANGWVEPDGDSLLFHAPDAITLLSDGFLDHHCFRAIEGSGETEGLVGLEFAPVRSRVLPDVRGVLWLERATAHLRYLEYRYTGLDYQGRMDRLGGRVTFHALEGGPWIVSEWYIRMPALALDGEVLDTRQVPRIVALIERGGTLLGVRPDVGGPDAPGEIIPVPRTPSPWTTVRTLSMIPRDR
ncbi:MAG TPA: carboxypeptidase-like regulatory domain-containing protein [Longimicrobium sp.]|nr:carboxypeptidase-like regulatory domain-containing protein [Longimicrobium sp.]